MITGVYENEAILKIDPVCDAGVRTLAALQALTRLSATPF